jgi:hypothetical protein
MNFVIYCFPVHVLLRYMVSNIPHSIFPTSTLFKHTCLLVQCTQLSRELAVQVFLTEPQCSIEHSLGNAGV